MKLDIIPEKKRKLTFAIFSLVSILVALFTGQIDPEAFVSALKAIVMAFMAGNGVEHLSKSGGGLLGSLSFGAKKPEPKFEEPPA